MHRICHGQWLTSCNLSESHYSTSLFFQARPGRCWTLNLPPEVTSYVQQVTEELVASGIVGQLLDLVCAFDWIAEAEKLSSERGLGHPKHRKQVQSLQALSLKY